MLHRKLLIVALLSLPGWRGNSQDGVHTGGISLDDLLPGIAWAESRSHPSRHSYLGPEYGRGLYGVSEDCLAHFNQVHGSNWKPNDLYSPHVNRVVARWYLGWLDQYYTRHPDRLRRVLSAYNQGWRATDRWGVNNEYVDNVLTNRSRN